MIQDLSLQTKRMRELEKALHDCLNLIEQVEPNWAMIQYVEELLEEGENPGPTPRAFYVEDWDCCNGWCCG